MGRRIRKFIRLTAKQRRYLLHAIGELGLARISLARKDTTTILAQLTQPFDCSQVNVNPAGSRPDLKLVSWAIVTAARNVPWRADCLPQAMAAVRWLMRAGYRPQVSLGVARNTGSVSEPLRAHAWVTIDSLVITGGGSTEIFEPLLPLKSEASANNQC